MSDKTSNGKAKAPTPKANPSSAKASAPVEEKKEATPVVQTKQAPPQEAKRETKQEMPASKEKPVEQKSEKLPAETKQETKAPEKSPISAPKPETKVPEPSLPKEKAPEEAVPSLKDQEAKAKLELADYFKRLGNSIVDEYKAQGKGILSPLLASFIARVITLEQQQDISMPSPLKADEEKKLIAVSLCFFSCSLPVLANDRAMLCQERSQL